MTELGSKEELEKRKLDLEIKLLSSPFWKRPSFLVPAVTALLGLAVAQFLGFFDIQLKALENRRELLKIETHKLEEKKQQLHVDKQALEKEIEELRAALSAESAALLRGLFLETTTSKEVGLWIVNEGKGVAHIQPYIIYIDGKADSQLIVDTLDKWRIVLERISINEPWVRMVAVESERSAITPGGKKLVLCMEPTEFNISRYHRFMRAAERLGLAVVYETSLGKRDVFVYGNIPSNLDTDILIRESSLANKEIKPTQ